MALFYSERARLRRLPLRLQFRRQLARRTGCDGRAELREQRHGASTVRVPTLRNIALTAPYMHDGRFSTLEAVVDHYESAGCSAASVDA